MTAEIEDIVESYNNYSVPAYFLICGNCIGCSFRLQRWKRSTWKCLDCGHEIPMSSLSTCPICDVSLSLSGECQTCHKQWIWNKGPLDTWWQQEQIKPWTEEEHK
jgi:hypothetical protein